jgi:hypothetical protein
MHRADLKQAIPHHPLWCPEDPENPPIFDLCDGDFLAANKKTTMLFILTKSKVPQHTTFFKTLYDGKPKSYPNGSMMVFIPFSKGTHSSAEYWAKILFNHENFMGDQMAISIGGLNNLNNLIKPKSLNQKITLRAFLKSLPASKGMSSLVLFQHVEPNFTNSIMMVVFQKMDHPFVMAHQGSLEGGNHMLIAEGEEAKVFLNPQDGLWFSGIHKNQGGHFNTSVAPTKSGVECANHVNSIMKSPPMERPFIPLTATNTRPSPPATPATMVQAPLPHRCISQIPPLLIPRMTSISFKFKKLFYQTV